MERSKVGALPNMIESPHPVSAPTPQMLPLLAGPGTQIICLDDQQPGTILEISEMQGKLAYLVQLQAGTLRLVCATHLQPLPFAPRKML
jgi:hypothetical protein